MSFKRRAATIIMTAVMAVSAVSLSGCADTSYVADISGVNIPAGLYIMCQFDGATAVTDQFKTEYPDVDTTAADFSYFGYTVGGVDFSDAVKTASIEVCKRYAAIEKKFDELGLVLSDEEKTTINDTVSSAWNDENKYLAFYGINFTTWGAYYESLGISKNSYKLFVTNAKKEEAVFKAYYGEGGTVAVSAEDKNAYLTENYALAKYVSIKLQDSAGADLSGDEAKVAEFEQLAQGYADELAGGEKFSVVSGKYDAYFLGTEYVAPTEEVDEDGFFKVVAKTDTSPSEAFVTNLFGLTYDTPVVYKEDTVYYVIVRYDITKTGEYSANYDSTVLHALKDDAFDELLKGEYDNFDTTLNQAAVDRYDPRTVIE